MAKETTKDLAKTDNNTTLAVASDLAAAYPILDPTSAAEMAELLGEIAGNSGFSLRDLTTISMPSGGGKFWGWTNSATGEEESSNKIVGIIVHFQDSAALWLKSDELGNPPDCYSTDGITGNPRNEESAAMVNAKACKNCQWNQYDPDAQAAGRASCKPIRNLFVVREGETLPTIVRLSRMSIPPCKKYFFNGLLNQNKTGPNRVVTSIGLEGARSEIAKAPYSVATFSLVEKLPPEAVKMVSAYKRDVLQLMGREIINLATGAAVGDAEEPTYDDYQAAPVAYADDVE